MLITSLLKPSNTNAVDILNYKKQHASGKSKAGIFTLTMTAKHKTDNVLINVTLRRVRESVAAVKSKKTYIF
jgi:hypothetical protein